MPEFVPDRDFRDFRRYTNDGLPYEPAAAPLPVGDPASGAQPISKLVMRNAFGYVDESLTSIAATRGYIEGLVVDAVSATEVPIFSTVSALALYDVPDGMNVIRVTGWSTAGTGGFTAIRNPSSTHPYKFTDGGGAVWEPVSDPAKIDAFEPGVTSVVIGIGTTGDYADLPTATESLRHYLQSGRQRFDLTIVSPLTAGLFVEYADFRKFTIKSSIGTVSLASGWTGYSDAAYNANNKTRNLIQGHCAQMPVLDCVIDMGHTGDSGYYGIWGCEGTILPGAGIINAGYCGLEMRASRCNAYSTVWNGANQSGIRVAHSADVSAQSATANNCCRAVDSGPTTGAVDVSRTSTLHFRAGSATGSGAAGMNVRRTSRCTFEDANFSGAASYGVIFQDVSSGSGYGAIVEDVTGTQGMGYGIWIRGGMVDLQGATIRDNAGADIRIGDSSPFQSGAHVDVTNVTTTTGQNKIADYLGIDRFNLPNRYGILENAAMPSPLDIGKFSEVGASRGWEWDESFHILKSSAAVTTSSTHMQFFTPASGGTVAGTITTTGSATSYGTTSDGRLKRNQRAPDSDAIAWLHALRVRQFEWPDGATDIGLIAQELLEVEPGAVSVGEGEPGQAGFVPMSVDYSKLVPKLILALQAIAPKGA